MPKRIKRKRYGFRSNRTRHHRTHQRSYFDYAVEEHRMDNAPPPPPSPTEWDYFKLLNRIAEATERIATALEKQAEQQPAPQPPGPVTNPCARCGDPTDVNALMEVEVHRGNGRVKEDWCPACRVDGTHL